MTQSLTLSEFLPFRLSVLSNTLSRRISDYYARTFNIGIGEWRVLAVIGEYPGLTATDVTKKTVMDKVAVSRAVSALIEKSYIQRTATQSDGRRSKLKLTSEGNKIYREIVPAAREYEAEITQALTPQELDRFNATLAKIAKVAAPDQELW